MYSALIVVLTAINLQLTGNAYSGGCLLLLLFLHSFFLFSTLAKICTRFSVETSTIKLKLLTQCAEWPQFTVDYGNLACCTWGCSSYSGPLRTAGQNDTDWLILSYIKNSCEWLTLSPLIPLRLYTLPY